MGSRWAASGAGVLGLLPDPHHKIDMGALGRRLIAESMGHSSGAVQPVEAARQNAKLRSVAKLSKLQGKRKAVEAQADKAPEESDLEPKAAEPKVLTQEEMIAEKARAEYFSALQEAAARVEEAMEAMEVARRDDGRRGSVALAAPDFGGDDGSPEASRDGSPAGSRLTQRRGSEDLASERARLLMAPQRPRWQPVARLTTGARHSGLRPPDGPRTVSAAWWRLVVASGSSPPPEAHGVWPLFTPTDARGRGRRPRDGQAAHAGARGRRPICPELARSPLSAGGGAAARGRSC